MGSEEQPTDASRPGRGREPGRGVLVAPRRSATARGARSAGIRRRGRVPAFAVGLACALLGGCRHEAAIGNADDVVVAANPDLWGRVKARVTAKLEPSRIARGKKDFKVSFQDPTKPTWEEQRKARQLLLIGTSQDAWVKDALSHAESTPASPAVIELDDVWSKPQQVTVLSLPEGDARAAVTERLDTLRARLEERYRTMVIGETFATGTNTALGDSLLESSGFTLLIPTEWTTQRKGDVFSFRKADDSTKVVRQVTVTWKSPIPPGLQGQGLLDWRAQALAAAGAQQSVSGSNVDATQTTHRGNVAYQLLGSWSGSGKSKGPFILRAIFCPTQDRVYLVDGWLSAPDAEQHRNLVALESILNSFRCGSARASQPNE